MDDNVTLLRRLDQCLVTLEKTATVEDARKAMQSDPDVQDAFITESGGRDSPVLGWLCDRDLIAVEQN